MHRRLPLAPLSALALLISAGAAVAAPPGLPLAKGAAPERGVEWYDVRDHAAARAAAPAQSPRAAAEAFLQGAAAELRLDGVDLRFQSDLAAGASRTVRFSQTHRGLPVIGAVAAVRLGADGAPRATVLEVARGLTVSEMPTIGEEAAWAAVAERVGMTPAVRPTPRLAVLPLGEGRLVWMVDAHPGSPQATRYLVDAHEGSVVGFRPLALTALGRVYETDRVTTPNPVDVTLTDLVASTPQTLTGWAGNLTVANYVSGGQTQSGFNYEVEQSLGPSAGEDFLYDPPADDLDPSDGFSQVNVYHHMTRIRDYFASVHAVDMTANTWKVTAVANMLDNGDGFNNAFFAPDSQDGLNDPFKSPNLMGIGQGTEFDFADDSDVFLHEFGHYISHNAIGYNLGQLHMNEYGISPWSGAIDEGVADYFACSLNGNATLGEASLAKLGAERDLTITSSVCPDDVLGEVHYDGEIIGSLSWTIRTLVGQDLGDRLVWGAMQTLTPGATLGDYGRGLLQVADEMQTAGELDAAQVTAIEDAIRTRGLDDCDHVLSLDDEERVINQLGLDVLGQLFGANCETLRNTLNVSMQSFFHFSATPAAGDAGLRLRVELTPVGGNDLSWAIYARKGQTVEMTPAGFVGLPAPSQFDHRVEGLTGTNGELVIDASSDPPFDPNATYYFVMMNQNCPTTQARVVAEPATPSTGEGGGGGAGGGGGTGGQGGDEPTSDPVTEDKGCGCRVAGGETPAGGRSAALLGLGLGLGALALRRRRAAGR